MSKVQEILNVKYAGLCQQLGDLSSQRTRLDLRITELKDEIDGLNSVIPSMLEVEQHLTQTHSNELDKIEQDRQKEVEHLIKDYENRLAKLDEKSNIGYE